MPDLVIKNGKLLLPERIVDAGIAIEDGKILKIAKQASLPKADNVIDARGNYVLPGLIDCHVHFREPGLTHKEDWMTGSQAAVAGGITTVLDMPNTKPPTTTVKLLNKKRNIALRKSAVNFGIHFGSTKENLEEIKKASNVASTKVFMHLTTGEMMIDDERVMENIFEDSGIVTVHAEDDNVRGAIELAQKTETRLYLCHISKKEEIGFIKNKTRNTFVEVTPHHLFLTKDDEKRLGTFGLMKPRLGDKRDKLELWSALRNGVVDTIASDHAPHTMEEKESSNPPFGVPGIETTLPLLLNEVNRKNLRLEDVVGLMVSNPLEIFGIINKGKIQEGYDADLTIVDLKMKKNVKNDELFTKCRWSPFNNWKLKGWPTYTIVNGKIAFEDGNVNKIRGKEVSFKNE